MHQEGDTLSPWFMLGCAALLAFGIYVPVFCIPPMEHIISEELLLSHAQASLLFTLPFVIFAAMAIPSGLLADRIGMRKAAGIGVIIVVVGSLMRGASTNFPTLLAFTFLYGIGFALTYPNLPKLVGAWFPREKAGIATGIYVTGMTLGPSLSLAITLSLIYPVTNTFRGTIYLWTIPAICGAILWWIVVREPSHRTIQNQQVGGGGRSFSQVWKNRNIWLVGLMLFFINVQYYTWSAWAPALLMQKGASPNLAAAITSVRSWAGIPFIFLIPWVSYKVGLRKPFILTCTIVTALASWTAMYIPVPLFWLLMAVLAIAGNVVFPMILALPVEMMPEESIGAASGMVLSIGYTGALVGPWVAGRILDITQNLNLALIMLVGVAVAWTCVAFIMPETGPKARLLK